MLPPNFLEEISVEVDVGDQLKVLHTPMNRNTGMWETAAAVAQVNYQHQVGGIGDKLDQDYDFNAHKQAMADQLTNPEYKRIFMNSNAYSAEEAARHLDYFSNMEYMSKQAGEAGGTTQLGFVLGHMADAAVIPGVGAAYGVGKMLKNFGVMSGAYKAMRVAGATAGQARFAATTGVGAAESVGFDVGYTTPKVAASEADADSMYDNIAIGLAATSTLAVAGQAYKAVKGGGDALQVTQQAVANGQNPIRDIQNAHTQVGQVRKAADDATANPGEEYVKQEAKVNKLEIPSRYSQTRNSESDTLNEAQGRLFTDPTTGKTNTDIHIQATAADNEVSQWVTSTAGKMGDTLHTQQKSFLRSKEGKVWMKDNQVSVWDRVLSKPINDRMGYQIHRAMSTGQIDTLPKGLQDMARTIDAAQKETYDMMKKFGVEGTENLDHIEGHMRRLHDPDAYSRFMRYGGRDVKAGETALLSVLEESIFRGSAQTAQAMSRPLARRIAYILQHRVLAQGKDKFALEEFLSSPNAMYKHAKDHGLSDADALDLTRQAFNDVNWAPGKAANPNKFKDAKDAGKHTMLRHRIPMDLSVKVPNMKNVWKDDFQVSDLMVNDAFGLADRYVRRGMGNAALAKRGWKSPAQIEEMLSKIREELKYAADREKATTQMLRFENGVNRVLGTSAFEEATGAQARLAMITGMLGSHATGVMLGGAGIAAMGELAKVINRTGFKAILNLVPALRSTSDQELLKQFEKYHYYIGNSRMTSRFSHFEDFGTNAFGVAGALAGQSAQAALRLSGLTLIDKMSRQSALIGWTDRLVQQVRKGHVSSKDFKLSEMGWKNATFDKIKAHIKAHGMNMDDWRLPNGHQDTATIEAFTAGAHKVVSENITKAFHGETNDFIDGPIGSMFLQFRKITLQTYNKALMKGLAHPDAIAASNLVAGLFGAIFVSELRSAAKTAGMDDKEKQAYLNKYNLRHAIMNESDLAQPFFSTFSYSPEMGMGLELLSLGSVSLFGQHLSGRSASTSDTIFAAPSVALAENMMRFSGHMFSAPFKDEPDWEDALKRGKQAVTAQNWYAFPYIYNTYLAPDNN